MSAIGREPGAMPLSVLDELDRWMARLGLARPSVAWAEWAIPEAWRPELASAPAGPVSLSRDELLRLGVALLMRHPRRAAEILAAFGQWSIDLRHRRLHMIDLRVEPGDGNGLRVGCEGQTSELAQVFEPESTVVQACAPAQTARAKPIPCCCASTSTPWSAHPSRRRRAWPGSVWWMRRGGFPRTWCAS